MTGFTCWETKTGEDDRQPHLTSINRRISMPVEESCNPTYTTVRCPYRCTLGFTRQANSGQQLGLSPPVNKAQTKLGQTSLQSFYLYLRNNLDSIVDYQTYRRKGYFISSVWVEKTIDLLICRRLKLRGQNWSRQGAENVVTLRQLILNYHWQSYWQQQKAS